jgi:hypothetical protein
MSAGREWTVVLRGDWHLPHLANMLRAYSGNGEQNECRDEVVEQVETQIVDVPGDPVFKTTRPLVVIDPESVPMDDLRRALDRWQRWPSLTHEQVAVKALLDQIAEQTAPPKPDEPTGLGAVVEDDEGRRWVRGEHAWTNLGAKGIFLNWTAYADLAAVKVLSEGVTP